MDSQLELALAERHRRNFDALKLFRPMETQIPAIETRASEVVIRGGNRSGKSILGAAMIASAARRKPVIDLNGKPLPPVAPADQPLLIWVIGKGEKHIGQTIHRLLFEPGLVPLYREPGTGVIRAARNWEEKLEGSKQKYRDKNGVLVPIVAPPMIPPDEIDGEVPSYVNKGLRHFDVCRMKNGNVICAYTSTGDVKMGDPVDLIWIDEDILYPRYVAEWQARLSDKKGRLIWTAWPWATNFALVEMSDRAKEQAVLPNPDVYEITLTMTGNPFIDEDEKRKRTAGWSHSGGDEVASRDLGEFNTESVIMYPTYTKAVHGIGRHGLEPDKLEQALALTGNVPPPDWTHRLFLDPGHSYTAVLFVATPPMEFGSVRIVYDELYLRGYDAKMTAKAVHDKIKGRVFQDFVIDGRIARQTIVGIGKTYLQLYQEAWQEFGLRSVSTGYGFTFASDDVSAGILAVRDWLTIRSDGTTKLRVVTDACPNFHFEIQLYRKHVAGDEAQEKPAGGQRDHLMDDLRYAAMFDCPWVPPVDPSQFVSATGAYQAFLAWKVQQSPKPKTDNSFHLGAGPIRSSSAA